MFQHPANGNPFISEGFVPCGGVTGAGSDDGLVVAVAITGTGVLLYVTLVQLPGVLSLQVGSESSFCSYM